MSNETIILGSYTKPLEVMLRNVQEQDRKTGGFFFFCLYSGFCFVSYSQLSPQCIYAQPVMLHVVTAGSLQGRLMSLETFYRAKCSCAAGLWYHSIILIQRLARRHIIPLISLGNPVHFANHCGLGYQSMWDINMTETFSTMCLMNIDWLKLLMGSKNKPI